MSRPGELGLYINNERLWIRKDKTRHFVRVKKGKPVFLGIVSSPQLAFLNPRQKQKYPNRFFTKRKKKKHKEMNDRQCHPFNIHNIFFIR